MAAIFSANSAMGESQGVRGRHLSRDHQAVNACRAFDSGSAAEREGFEPSVELLILRTLSKRLPSATRSPLQVQTCRSSRRCVFGFWAVRTRSYVTIARPLST